MEYNIISSGSQGNAVVIENSILIDCGVSFRALSGVYKDLQLVLLTHIHSDHFSPSTLARLSKERPALRFACCEWLKKPLLAAGIGKRNIDVLQIGVLYSYGAFQVAPVRLYHNVPNCGWRVFAHGEKLFYATDTGTLEGICARDYDLYMVEANYNKEEIGERIRQKEAAGVYAYEYEVRKNHLSLEACNDFIYENIGEKGQYIYMHRHKEHDAKH